MAVRRGDEATVRTPVLGDGRPIRATVGWVLGGAVGGGLGALVWSLVEPRRWVPARLRGA